MLLEALNLVVLATVRKFVEQAVLGVAAELALLLGFLRLLNRLGSHDMTSYEVAGLRPIQS